MTISLANVPRRRDGTWSHDVDRLVVYLRAHPLVTVQQVRLMFPAIPEEALDHIFEERKRRRTK